MGKYKVGDEVLLKVKIIEDLTSIYGLKTQDGIVFNAKKENLLPIPDITAEESWDIANRITASTYYGGLIIEELVEIFGTSSYGEIFKQNTPSESKAKIEAWEAEKEIKFGDIIMNEGLKCVVTRVMPDKIYTVSEIGTTPSYCGEHIKKLKKIGHHEGFDGLLKQIGDDK